MTACYGMTQFEFDPDKDLKEYRDRKYHAVGEGNRGFWDDPDSR